MKIQLIDWNPNLNTIKLIKLLRHEVGWTLAPANTAVRHLMAGGTVEIEVSEAAVAEIRSLGVVVVEVE